jgi:CRP/FNR family transcriptional regulator
VLCSLPAQQLRTLSETTPALGHRMLDMVSRELADALMMAGDYTAEQRVAGFLLRIGRHSPDRDHFDLDMSRRDIANCLRLVTETVSRVLTRFRDEGLIRVARRSIELCDRERLSRLAEPMAQMDMDTTEDERAAAA